MTMCFNNGIAMHMMYFYCTAIQITMSFYGIAFANNNVILL